MTSCFIADALHDFRNLSFTYPNAKEPALKDVSFCLEAGEMLAIVGYNGSGKSTLANVLLRLQEFDNGSGTSASTRSSPATGTGELLINDTDIRRLDPEDYHGRVTTVLQNFVKYEASARDNIGVGYVQDLRSRTAVERAMALGEAEALVNGLPRGMKTRLDSQGLGLGWGGFSPLACPQIPGMPSMDDTRMPQGLSGGEVSTQLAFGTNEVSDLCSFQWQRVAISRAFMRAHRPEVDLMVFDEPVRLSVLPEICSAS
jgi:ABC-type sugar transport system ATPase subunit